MNHRNSRIGHRRHGEQGFTLIELLVVIIILGILSAVVVFAVRGTGDKGAEAAMATDYKTMQTAQEAFCAKNGHYAPTEAALADGNFLSEESTSHDISSAAPTGACGSGTDPAKPSGYRITCAPGVNCTAGGGTPLGGIIRVAGNAGATAVAGTNFLNPAVSSGGGVHANTEYMFNGLMRWAENNTPQPDLAQSYTISPDQKTYTFTMRPAGPTMTWHNGDPITPADVKFTFEQALLKFHGRTQASVGAALGVTGSGSATTTPPGAITTTATTVAFNFAYSYAPLLKQMNVTEAPIIPASVYGPCATAGTIAATTCPGNNPGSGDFPAQTMVGSGPFKLKSRNTTTGALVFVKNTNYHLAGLPLADEVNQVPVSNVGDALTANPRVVDVGTPANNRILPIVAPQTSADVTPANGFSLTQPPRGGGGGNCTLTEAFNLWAKGTSAAAINALPANAPYTHPIFGDQTVIPANAGAGRPNPMSRGLVVRTALHMATDRQSLFNAKQFGKGKLATSPYNSGVAGYSNTGVPGYDQAKAAQWLTDAGWTDTGGTVRVNSGAPGMGGAPATLTFGMVAGENGSNPNGQTAYRIAIATQWTAVKVDLTDGGFPAGDANGNFGGSGAISHARDRNYDMITASYCNGDDPVIGVRRQYYSATSASPTAGSQISSTAFTNYSGYRTTSMDTLWDQAAKTGSAAAHAAIQAEAAANVPHLWLDESLGSRAWKTAKCAGFNNFNTGLFVETGSCVL